MFSAAIFDMDGLLIDSERVIMQAWIEAARAAGVVLRPEACAAVIGLADAESDEILAGLLGGRDVFTVVRSTAERRCAVQATEHTFPLKSGARELLFLLRAAEVPCAIASSSSIPDVRQRLSGVGILEYFDALAGGNEVARGKPDPAVYELAAARLGAAPTACLAFEDSGHGALAALGAGAQVVLVPDLQTLPAEWSTRSLRILARLDDAIEHLPDWFGTGSS
jgi:HAD superfamily hydrolase (TIGR01509 family)